jgi:hypothetical protein
MVISHIRSSHVLLHCVYNEPTCSLLHEARTKNGWRIWGHALEGQIVDVDKKILDRDNFQDALLTYIEDYGLRLMQDNVLQAAYIRKFDVL